jgi:N-acetylmuramoyl-L-alanine amidase
MAGTNCVAHLKFRWAILTSGSDVTRPGGKNANFGWPTHPCSYAVNPAFTPRTFSQRCCPCSPTTGNFCDDRVIVLDPGHGGSNPEQETSPQVAGKKNTLWIWRFDSSRSSKIRDGRSS